MPFSLALPARVAAGALLVLTGCQVRDGGPAAPGGEPADTPTETDVSGGLPAALAGLNLQTNHASGSVLRVTGVRFEPDHIAVAMAFTNGSDYEQELNQYSHNNFVLRDNLGNVYNLSAPPNNGDVAVPAGQSLNGEFVFLGRLHPDATQLTVVTNEEHGSAQDTARDPKMSIQIPLP